jgi:hypothetical protein
MMTTGNYTDVSTLLVRPNSSITYSEVLQRFPTYAVCYAAGNASVLSQYDILIVDPFTAKAADVLAWQALGIMVYGYVSLGEEKGFHSNRYDFTSALGPYVGDGTGPGGNASYYLKGGYQARECAECLNDRQAVAGQKACAQSQPMYYLGTGRCSGACSLDSMGGYATYLQGGTCGGGFTSANNWVRKANAACTNNKCKSYKPVHQLQTGTACGKYTPVSPGYLQDFSLANPTTPDENGVAGSYYADSGKATWLSRIMNYYVPTVLNGPVAVSQETVTLKTVTIPSGNVLVFDTAMAPIDPDATITLTTLDGKAAFHQGTDFTFDMRTGAFVLTSSAAATVISGQQLLISYTRKGDHMDGLFLDNIDDADVYPQMGSLIATLINTLKTNTGARLIANRGFTNLTSFIQSCAGVMFQSWLTTQDTTTGAYSKITDQTLVAVSNQQNALLQKLRMTHVFDVYSLNFCNADSSGDALRLYCAEEDRKKGYLSWTTTAGLGSPAANTSISTADQRIAGTAFQRSQLKRY